ncbi:uncharacterized protein LOC127877594 isoform X3 [Dreissena polymorpha]|uniref:uncharacterized protein LOC127877594 isoform X3 n=1 Tax=Dreissena polymorpha TaxID=45954 RepID=UPI0022644971|nr:uncharacterized protein LOC127877594 isoform X3 [Dreissena polymorpha]
MEAHMFILSIYMRYSHLLICLNEELYKQITVGVSLLLQALTTYRAKSRYLGNNLHLSSCSSRNHRPSLSSTFITDSHKATGKKLAMFNKAMAANTGFSPATAVDGTVRATTSRLFAAFDICLFVLLLANWGRRHLFCNAVQECA